MEVKLTDENFKKEILESDLPALVDFWAPWCGPCNIVAPIIEEIAIEYQGKLKVGKVNVDEAPKVASQYGIASIPTLSVFKNGERVDSVVGAVPMKQIISTITPHL